MLEDHKRLLRDASRALFGLRASLFDLEESRDRTFKMLSYFAYLYIPLIMIAPMAKWKAMLTVAIKDMDIAQACIRAMTAPLPRVA